jgi:uncharacterized membrane-anchored protein YitT (DUF2179 family)
MAIDMKKIKKQIIIDIVQIAVGCFAMAIAYNAFMLGHKIAPGGVSGIAAILYHISGQRILPGVAMLVINIPLFLIALRQLGGLFGVKTLLATVLYSVFVDAFQVANMTEDPILASVYGGVIMGAGLGLILRTSATSGGTDLIAKLIHEKIPAIGISWVLFAIDSVVVIAAGIVFGATAMLYALITLFFCSKAIDIVLEGFNLSKCFLIISDHSQAIAEGVFEQLDRGATLLHGRGAYSKQDKDVLLCVVPRIQVMRLKQIIRERDERAFVLLADVREVIGEGFQPMTYDDIKKKNAGNKGGRN